MMRWRGVLIPEGRETVDGRTVAKGAVTWDGAVLVMPHGSADVWREDDDVWAEGSVSEIDRTSRPEADLVADVTGGPIDENGQVCVVDIHQARLVAVTFGERPAWPDLPFEWLS